MNNKLHRQAFLKAVKEHDLSVYFHRNDHYILIKGGDSSRIVSIQLICSTKIDHAIHGSSNGNEPESIGHFKFTVPKWEEHFNFYVFAFVNAEKTDSEFVIVSDEVLRSRLTKLNRIPASGEKAELTLWLMPDHCVYDCTNISVEGEWYWLSKGVNGRRADGESNDFTQYLNNWKGIALDLSQRNS